MQLLIKVHTVIHGHMLTGEMLTGQMLTPLSKNRTNAHKIWFWHGKFVNTFTARCTIVQSTVLPSLSCTADVMWNARWIDLHRLRLGAGQAEHDSDDYVQVVVDAGAITSHFCSPVIISPTMSLSWSRATVLRRLWSSHRRCRRKYKSCLRIRPRLYKDVMPEKSCQVDQEQYSR